MKNFWARVLLMIIIFPFLLVVIVWLPFAHHLLFNAAVTAVALIGSFEIKNMLVKKGIPVMKVLSPILAATLPAAAYLEETRILFGGFLGLWIAAVFGVYFVITICASKQETLQDRLPLMASSVFILFCPSFFLTFIVRITSLPHPEFALLFLLAAVFANDIFAYLAGMLARGKTRLNLPASPNKSLIGFIFGFIGAVGVMVGFAFLFKDYFTIGLPQAALLGVLLGITANVGDLFESALKRSCQLKDSGVIMAGRGGIMDAIDSLLLSAPLFLFVFPLIAAPVA